MCISSSSTPERELRLLLEEMGLEELREAILTKMDVDETYHRGRRPCKGCVYWFFNKLPKEIETIIALRGGRLFYYTPSGGYTNV